MNRTLKRPMFRMGGSTNSGITSGLDVPRKQYSTGTDPYDKAVKIRDRYEADMDRYKGEQAPLMPGGLPNFLTSFGLNLMSQTPTGNIFSTAATAAKEPFKTFQAANLAKRQDRQERLDDIFSGALSSEYDLLEADRKKGDGSDGRMSSEVERDIITNAQNNIFDQLDIINNSESTPAQIDAAQRQIKINTNVLTKELGVSPEYISIISDPDLFGDSMEGYVNAENKRRIDEYVKNNPGATPKQIQDNVPQMQEGTAQARDFTFKKLKEKYGYTSYKADGGRIGLAFGGDTMMPAVAEAPKDEVQDLSYTELRSRLPQEISNDIVQLLANSKQALMDFANIQTGEDIASFNQQYDVNLTLPQGA